MLTSCLHERDKILTADTVDKIVSARIPDAKLQLLAYETVSRCQKHGPCGAEFPLATCMKGVKNIQKKVVRKHNSQLTSKLFFKEFSLCIFSKFMI